MGGVIAFEMAQQLQAESQEIALLALFDTHCPGMISDWRRRKNIVFSEIRNSYKLLRRNPATQQRLISEKFELYLMRTNTNSPVVNPNRRAVRRYKPDPYPGKVNFFWASGRGEKPSDSRRGWQELAKLGIDIHRIPGDHYSMLREPQLQALAERLKDCLDNAASI